MPGDTTSTGPNELSLSSPQGGIRAQRIRFVQNAAGPSPIARFVHPYPRFAIAEAVAPADLLSSAPSTDAPSKNQTAADDELFLLVVPSGAVTALEIQRQVESWMHFSAVSGTAPTVDLLMRSERVLWRPGRAALFGAPERCEELLPGLIEFAFYEGELRKLERELEAHWPAAEADAELTHGVGRAELGRQSRIDDITAAMTRRRIRFARIEPCLEKASIGLPGPARRLAGELGQQAEVVDRLRSLDDRLEVFEDLYELANDRLTEFAYFSREFRLELWIIVLLVLEVIVMGVDAWLTYRSGGYAR